ncbi:hypothetical protein ARMGADRAFT_1146752 [Armillaria gallica]|uniref:Uncharacterized protein n=1 Tax=Armillaria gallica TaxID=47427 RepID=A0A2H3CGP6_ARMGA|nr:hypothetical protein ARMGADRAFT_1146752 [Armillaria gallica]
MFANMYKLALRRKTTPQFNPATKSRKYIRISKGDKYYVFLKSQVPTYEWLIYHICTCIPGMYRKVHNRWDPIPIVIKTYDLPSCRGNCVNIPPSWWTTVITDIDNIHIIIVRRRISVDRSPVISIIYETSDTRVLGLGRGKSSRLTISDNRGARLVKLYMLYMIGTRHYHTAGFIKISSIYV